MKSFFVSLFLLLFIQLNAQIKIKLPTYYLGTFSSDTIFKSFTPMDDNGDGSVTFQSKLTSTLLTGVKFYLLIDSIDRGGAPSGVITAFVTTDSSRAAEKGQKYELPAKFKVLAGKLGFSILIEGTPSVNNEAYYCDLEMLLPTCNCMDAVLRNKTEQTCNVSILNGVEATSYDEAIAVYPNPASHTVMLRTPSCYAGKPYFIIDNNGKQVLGGVVSNGTTTVTTSHLPVGNYYIQVQDVRKVLSIIK